MRNFYRHQPAPSRHLGDGHDDDFSSDATLRQCPVLLALADAGWDAAASALAGAIVRTVVR